MRTGDGSFARWPAEDFGQVNPQFTDLSPGDRIVVNGYFAFYVPPGQYKVLTTAPGCSPYESPILTVVEEPIFHNVPLRCAQSSAGQGGHRVYVPMVTRGGP